MSDSKEKTQQKIAISTQRNIRISPRKMSLLANAVRGEKSTYTLDFLKTTNKKGARLLLPIIETAIANLKNIFGDINTDNVIVSDIQIGSGVTMKRLMPVSRGRGHRIRKRTTNVKVSVSEKVLTAKSNKEESK